MPVIPVLRRLRQENHKNKASLGCAVACCLRNKKIVIQRNTNKGKTIL
jgi:hypothetical protein